MKKKDLDVKVRYYTRHNKSYLGDSPIMVRLYVNGERACLGQVGLSIQPCYLKNNRVLSTSSKSQEFNETLQDVECRIHLVAERLSAIGGLSLSTMREALSPSRPATYTLVGMYDQLLSESTALYQAQNLCKSTYRGHLYQRPLLIDYLQYQYGCEDLALSSIRKDELSSFEQYLKNRKGYTHNSAVRALRFMKKAVQRAVEEDLLSRSPFLGVKLRTLPTNRGFLDEDDLQRLSRVELRNPKLRFVRDAFLFSCYTGLSYADISRLTSDNIISMHGQQWIVIRRKKTKELSNIPLMSMAIQILSPYLLKLKSSETKDRIFPLPSNSWVNQRLEQIRQLSGIDRHLSYHLARHTFATLALTKGVSLDTVGNVLGHSCLSTTQIYAKVLPLKVYEEMRGLDHRLQTESLIS